MQKRRIMKWLGICAGIMVCGLTQQVIFADENEETIIRYSARPDAGSRDDA